MKKTFITPEVEVREVFTVDQIMVSEGVLGGAKGTGSNMFAVEIEEDYKFWKSNN